MSAEETDNAYYEGGFYALIIGISEYEHGFSAEENPDPDKFPNLKWAHQDALDFKAFLVEHGAEKSIECLINKDASTVNIKTGFGKLMKFCKSTHDPLVFIYFAGHGWREDNSNYLVPYNGEKGNLYGTAIRNDEFSRLLNDLDTEKLVVFLDACHSGAVKLDGERSGDPELYDPVRLGDGKGRYIIASCSPGQKSYEVDNNGIFTRHLLNILNFKDEDLLDVDELTTGKLFDNLQEKVKNTAKSKKGEEQLPWADGSGTGITLNVNMELRRRRIKIEIEEIKKRIDFLQNLSNQVEKRTEFKNKHRFKSYLDIYVNKNNKYDRFEDFYECYEEFFNEWKEADSQTIVEVEKEACGVLIILFEEILIPNKSLKTPTSKTPTSQPVASNQAASNPTKDSETSTLAAEKLSEPEDKIEKGVSNKSIQTESENSISYAPNLAPNISQEHNEPMRKMMDHAFYILEPIYNVEFLDDHRKFSDCLRKPLVSKKQFEDILNGIQKQREDEGKSVENLKSIKERFDERWKITKDIEIKFGMNNYIRR